jgi:sarcosine oxidase subunit beta
MTVSVVLTKQLPSSADLVIIGGGIVGAATAFHAARAGLKAVVIEKRPMLCTLTTPAATGAFRAQFENPEEIELVQESISIFETFADYIGISGYDIDIHQQGYLWVTKDEQRARWQRELVDRQRSWGLADVELLNPIECRKRFPYLADDVLQARFRQKDGWLDVKKLTMGFAAASRATFCTGTEVTGFNVKSEKVKAVRTNRGSISCDRAVIAAGPFSGNVAALAGLDLKLTLRCRQRMTMLDVPEVPQSAPMTIDDDTGAHWRPAAGGAHLVFTNYDNRSTPALDYVPTSAEYYFALLDPESPSSVSRVSPFWKTVWERNTSHWYLIAGQYTYMPDQSPYIGASAIDGLYLNTGYSGHGIMGSAAGSRLLIDVITGKCPHDKNPFRPDRVIEMKELKVI